VYFAVFELGRGFVALFLYALMRPFLNPGPNPAVLAGVVAWIAFSGYLSSSVHSAGIVLERALD
jgi:hypothetical protein